MLTPMKWSFGSDLLPDMKGALDNFWTDTPEFFQRVWRTGTFMPAANVRETEKTYEIELTVPGVNKDDLKISLESDQLIVSSEVSNTEEEKKKNYTRREFSFQSFRRSFPLPDGVDASAVEARCEDGILFLTLPKVEPREPKVSQEIKIK